MRLKSIKLAGFKSFVDPTTVHVRAPMVGIVGPNGCGKSNVIDAVRWVMGEGSAKTLRGESMSDVIFNGSSARKPVGKAAVELIFDNSEGKAPGAYGQYAEISLRRELSRDGQSEYQINRSRCRRRDITDLLLDAGLGPRSYAVIEQGMVGRIVEARPEDLRGFVEDASGISRYKDRRRETETRIRHTRENLQRVEDIRSEMETQLRRLKRQASAAERYRDLRARERDLRATWLSLRWKAQNAEIDALETRLARLETDLQGRLAEQRRLEREIGALREQHTESQEQLSAIQGEFYAAGAEVSQLETRIETARERLRQREQERTRVSEALIENRNARDAEAARRDAAATAASEAASELEGRTRALEQALSDLDSADANYKQWQATWDRFNAEAAEPRRRQEVEQARINELEAQLGQLQGRRQQHEEAATALDAELGGIDLEQIRADVERLDAECRELDEQLDDLDERIRDARSEVATADHDFDQLRGRLQEVQARLTSLREVQAAALGEHEEELVAWLADKQLDRAPRLATRLSVRDGLEHAVDRVLGERLRAVCVDSLDEVASDVGRIERGALMFVEPGGRAQDAVDDAAASGLLTAVTGDGVDVAPLLCGVRVVDDLATALSQRHSLASGETLVARTGELVGRNWLSVAGETAGEGGILARAAEIERLAAEVAQVDSELSTARSSLEQWRERLADLEERRGETRRRLAGRSHERGELRSQLAAQEAHVTRIRARVSQVRRETDDLVAQIESTGDALSASAARHGEAARTVAEHEQQRERLQAEREQVLGALDTARQAADGARDARHRAELEHQRLVAAGESLAESLRRLADQAEELEQRQAAIEQEHTEAENPDGELQSRLADALARRVEKERALSMSRDALAELAEKLRTLEGQRAGCEEQVEVFRNRLSDERMARQEQVFRRDSLVEQLAELEREPEAVLGTLDADTNEAACHEELEDLGRKIERIGPVNLVAIDEYREQSERKVYLDSQYEDLSSALATLEDVIHKIDRETRARFKETFEQLNERFKTFFPQLFGGGTAYLELTSDDLLDTGVTVMARPPGKRNSTIHLLSGGEKALTAVALLFSFFELSPAPFCILDEVDAPLDDANVDRYSQTLKTLAERTQIIFITHNKITMESASVLIGVTMGEPGVSRLVSVDVEQAAEMAAG